MQKNFKILLIDDDPSLLESLADVLTLRGYSVDKATSGENGIKLLSGENHYNLALVDLLLPGKDGLEILKIIKDKFPKTSVIILTGHATIDSVVSAMKIGAVDYLEKPVKPEALILVVEKERQFQQLVDQNAYFMSELSRRYNIENIVGKSPVMLDVFEKLRAIASTESSVLITGESGTGKELIAHHIHYTSWRRNAPLIKVSCATLAPGVLESELFGHERGAFTGAVNSKPGRFEMADGGSLFLDEVGDIPLSFQTKLLRVLQSMEFERVGGRKQLKSDFRLISATNHNLKEDIEKEVFRKDLYYRLNVVEIEIPPLRSRKEDIPYLLNHFINIYSLKTNKRITKYSDEALEAMQNYRWPGNIREFKNVVERAFVYCNEDIIGLQHLPQYLQSGQGKSFDLSQIPIRSLEKMEKALIELCLWEAKDNKSLAAKKLEISRSTLHSKIKKYQIDKLE